MKVDNYINTIGVDEKDEMKYVWDAFYLIPIAILINLIYETYDYYLYVKEIHLFLKQFK